jgi:hypothetical protein
MGSSSAAFSICTGSSKEAFCSGVSDSGAQNRVFSMALSSSGSQDSLISIILSMTASSRPSCSAPALTAGSSRSVYRSMPLPDVQMNPSPVRPAYLAMTGPPAAM